LTHIAAREDFRRISLLAPVCTAGISGLGLEGYRWAVEGLAGLIEAGR
jgi:3-dehydroquinate dehydratase-2